MKILVTGGSSDIGKAIIRRLATAHTVLTTASSPESIQALQQEGISQVISCNFKNFDLHHDAVLKAIDEGVDALVLNACTRIPEYAALHEHKLETLFSFVDENTKPNIAILQRALPKMREKKLGRIVFISSMAAEMGLSQYAPYILAKASLEGLMRNIAVEYGKENITANTVRPGIIRTERTKHLVENPKYVIKVGRSIPSGEIGEPDQVAEVVQVLLSEQSYINGQAINVAGGFPLVGSLIRS